MPRDPLRFLVLSETLQWEGLHSGGPLLCHGLGIRLGRSREEKEMGLCSLVQRVKRLDLAR